MSALLLYVAGSLSLGAAWILYCEVRRYRTKIRHKNRRPGYLR